MRKKGKIYVYGNKAKILNKKEKESFRLIN